MHQTNHFEYHGSAEKIFKIWTYSLLLNILSLGIYSFWGKNLLRQYLAANFSMAGHTLHYTGSGKELCFSFLKALPLWVLLIASVKIFENTPLEKLCVIILFILIVYLTFVGLYASLKYRLTHTSWRDINCHMYGNSWRFGLSAFALMAVAICSLGLMLGWMDHHLYKKKFNRIFIGNLHVTYTGTHQALFKINLITLLLAIPTLGLSRIWYAARLRNYIYNHTQFGEFKILNTETGNELVKLYLWGFFITVLSLGLLYPLVINRKMQYIATHFALVGNLKLLTANADQPVTETMGEGLYDIMDAETDLW